MSSPTTWTLYAFTPPGAIGIEQRNLLPTHFDRDRRTRRDILRFRDFEHLAHEICLLHAAGHAFIAWRGSRTSSSTYPSGTALQGHSSTR